MSRTRCVRPLPRYASVSRVAVRHRAGWLLLLGAAMSAGAHDFWLQPARWHVEAHEPLGVTLQVGHGIDRQRSLIPARRVVRFEARGADPPATELRPALHIGAADDATVAFDRPGLHWIVLETDDRAESHLPAIRFNDYLRSEGLTPALALREQTGRVDREGAESYSRHAKTLVQVGRSGVGDALVWSTPLGLDLEIVPEGALPSAAGGLLTVRVYFHHEPLARALVKFNDLDHDADPLERQQTDAGGRARFTVPGPGSWQLNVIWTEPRPAGSLTDFSTRFSSLSFGLTG